VVIIHGKLVIKFDAAMHSIVQSSDTTALPLMAETVASEFIDTKTFSAKDFTFASVVTTALTDRVGKGEEWLLRGSYDKDGYSLEKQISIKLYDGFPDLATIKVLYINRSQKTMDVIRWVNNSYSVLSQGDSTLFWSFQGESTKQRKDWVLPLVPGFSQKNFMGMNNSDYGGGIPVTDIWRHDQGIAIGHLELIPKMVSLPVSLDRYHTSADIGIQMEYIQPFELKPNDSLATAETFVSVHSGDYYNPLKKYGELLRAKGLVFALPEPAAYESSWCAWGYMRDVTLNEIIGTLPKVKELGIGWVTIDDGFQQAEGDWHVNKNKFPGGDAQMKALVDKIHSYGLKAMLWWAPLAADPDSKLLKAQPDLRLLDADSFPRNISWWNAYYMCPAYGRTIQHTKEMVDLFISKWGFDGLKMDGGFINAAPADYNSLHHLAYPEQSFEKLPAFFDTIYYTARQLKHNVVIQNCPCGACMSVYNMPSMNLSVASDPLNSWQVRLKGKTYKALLGTTAYFGDHVELSDGGNDFATSFGIGAVLGTKFTWPKENPTVTENNLLTPEREKVWKKWFGLYNAKMLSKEKYLGGLYDIGYDKPETHVIQKGDTLHYAFYNKDWKGEISLKGLSQKLYRVHDYVNDVDLGVVKGPGAIISVKFKESLLLEVYPEK
jgi:alpha-galactosidase